MKRLPKPGDYLRCLSTGGTVKVKEVSKNGFAWIPVEIIGGFVYRDGLNNYEPIKHRKGKP